MTLTALGLSGGRGRIVADVRRKVEAIPEVPRAIGEWNWCGIRPGRGRS